MKALLMSVHCTSAKKIVYDIELKNLSDRGFKFSNRKRKRNLVIKTISVFS